MNFEWSVNDSQKLVATLYSTNITLNKAACKHFENVQFVLLGLDREKKTIGIKPIDKISIEQNIYPREQLHRFSLGKSYGRITNTNFIKQVIHLYDIDISNPKGVKYDGYYDLHKDVLIIQL